MGVGAGRQLGRLQVETPRWQEYCNLSYAGGASIGLGCLGHSVGRGVTGVRDLSSWPRGTKPQVRQLKTGPLSSVGRASPW